MGDLIGREVFRLTRVMRFVYGATPADGLSFKKYRVRSQVRREKGASVGAIDETRSIDAAGYTLLPPSRIPAGCNLYVRGWAIDSSEHSLAGAVEMIIDSEYVCESVYGLDRPDIAAFFENAELVPSGFKSLCLLGGLSLGQHLLQVRVFDRKLRMSQELGDSLHFEIVESGLQLPSRERLPDGSILIAVDPLQTQGQNMLIVGGWAFDCNSGACCEAVYAVVDDTQFVRAVYGFPRADVAQHLGTPTAFLAGFRVHLSTRHLAPGAHHVRVLAAGSTGFCEGPAQVFQVGG